MSDTKLRPLKRTPVFIEEDHNDVLRHIFRSVGSKHLPASNNVFIHFDSHPDMGIPFQLSHDDTLNIYDLYDKLSIESWILPAAYLGVISTVVWICPPWAQQIPEGKHSFLVGKHKDTGRILTTCPESYFLSEGLTTDSNNLDNVKTVSLIVFKLSDTLSSGELDPLLELVASGHYILDIDLDFYSTKNPFLDLYPDAGLYQSLKKIYTFDPVPKDLAQSQRIEFGLRSSEKRTVLLEKLMDITDFMQEKRSVEGYSGIGAEFSASFEEIHETIVANYGKDEQIDWKIIHNAGCTCDDIELPHHVSTRQEIEALVRQTEKFLLALRTKATIVTVARSSLDDFCPQDQVESIQESVLGILSRILGGEDKLEVKLCYKEENKT